MFEPSALRARPPIALAVTVIALAACAQLTEGRAPRAMQAPTVQQIDLFHRYLEALRQRAQIPGLSAAIVYQQRIIWDAGLGYQDRERRIAARADTPYRIASITKTFTSTLLMGCVDRKSLDLDAPISRYTTQIPESAATVRHVLSHTSLAPPGTTFNYDGNRFVALTPVVDTCTEQPYRQALATRILDRLAMQDSVPGHDLETPVPATAALFDAATLARYAGVIARLAKPYTRDSKGRVVEADYPPRGINASAGLISTVRDLAKYDAALDARILVSPAAQQLAWTPFVNPAGVTQPYALGWFSQQYAGTRLVWHYGQWAQFSALYLKIPERELTLILLANSGDLSTPFALGKGDVTTSTFARTFLGMFVN